MGSNLANCGFHAKFTFRIHDYYKLSNILTLQASAFQNILATFRPHPEYFKVSFLGTSYPLFVRNKEFIYRGLDFEKISDFTQRLSLEFPEAKFITKNSASDELAEQASQHLVICSVRPVKQDSAAYMGPSVPDRVRDFYSVNKISRWEAVRAINWQPSLFICFIIQICV